MPPKKHDFSKYPLGFPHNDIFMSPVIVEMLSVLQDLTVLKEPFIGHLKGLLYPTFNEQILQLEAISLQTTK